MLEKGICPGWGDPVSNQWGPIAIAVMSKSTATAATDPAQPPRVSVIVPIYNGAADIPELGACLLAQTYPAAGVEYLLVDNNSQDTTPELLQHFATQAAAQGLRVVPLTEAEIQSSYAARNRGIRAAAGEILVFTDADCRPEPDWLANMVQPFADLDVALVVGEIQALRGRTWLEQYAEYRGVLTQKYTLAHSFYPYGQTANLGVRRVALEKAGLFRPYLTTGGDADLCWRVQMAGSWRVEFAETAIIRHRHRATFSELASQWQRYGRSNRYLHDLYGVSLQPEISRQQQQAHVLRWLFKALPKSTWRWLRGQAPAVAVVAGLVDLFCARSREQGQRDAQLPEAARQIEWLTPPVLEGQVSPSE